MKIAVMGTDYATKVNDTNFINLSYISGIDEPLCVRSNYGWKAKDKPRENYIIYPPFKVLSRHARTIYTLGCTVIECSRAERVE